MKFYSINCVTMVRAFAFLILASNVFAKSKPFDYKNYLSSNGYISIGEGQYYKSISDDNDKSDLELSQYIELYIAQTKGDVLQITRISVNIEKQLAILVSGEIYTRGIKTSSQNLSKTAILESGAGLTLLSQNVAQKRINEFIKKVKRKEFNKYKTNDYVYSDDSVFTKVYSTGKSERERKLILAYAKLSGKKMIEIMGEFDCQTKDFDVLVAKELSFDNPYGGVSWDDMDSQKEVAFGHQLNCNDSGIIAREPVKVHYENISNLFSSKILKVPGLSLAQLEDNIVVVAVRYGSPAEKSGIQPGGIIERIDDLEETDLSSIEKVEKYLNNYSLGTVYVTQRLPNGKSEKFELIINED